MVDEPMICRRMVRIWLRKSVTGGPSDMAFLEYAVRSLFGSTIVERCKDIAKAWLTDWIQCLIQRCWVV